MASYETNHQYQIDRSTPPQSYSVDQYDGSSNSSSPLTNELLNSQKSHHLEDYPTPSTDTSHENDDSSSSINFHLNSFNINLNDPNRMLKYGENNYSNLLNYGYQLNQYFNTGENLNLTNLTTPEAVLQQYSVANFDPNFVPNSYVQNNNKSKVETEAENESKQETKQNSYDQIESKTKSQNSDNSTLSYLMQPPDSESIEAATASAKRNRPKRRSRTKFEKEQLDILELAFDRTHYPDVNVVDRLAKLLNLSTERISVWFQNRRARFKRSKKDPKKEPSNLNHNPILDDNGVFDNDDTDGLKGLNRVKSSNRISSERYDDEKSETTTNSFNENESDNEESRGETEQSYEAIKPNPTPIKPIFNPISLPTSTSNSNLQRAFYQPTVKQETYVAQNSISYSNQYQNLSLPVSSRPDCAKSDQNSSSSSSASCSSREPSPKPESEASSSPEPKHEQLYQPLHSNMQHIQFQQNNFQPTNILNMGHYQTGLNNNLYMPHMQAYTQNFPNIFQPFMDYNKPDLANPAYFQGLNQHPSVSNLHSYYNNQ